MTITIEYCATWNYEPHAVSLTEKLLLEFKHQIKALHLLPSTGGRFEVSVDGARIFSKHETKRFPEYSEIQSAMKRR